MLLKSKVEKIHRSAFSKKVLVCLKTSKKGPIWTQNDGFLTFHKNFSLLFAVSNLKWMKLQFPIFLCKPHIREKIWFSAIGENDLVQSDCRIIWSSISLEGIQYINIFLFLHGDVHQERITCQDTLFGWACPDMNNHAQPCIHFPGDPLG